MRKQGKSGDAAAAPVAVAANPIKLVSRRELASTAVNNGNRYSYKLTVIGHDGSEHVTEASNVPVGQPNNVGLVLWIERYDVVKRTDQP